MTKTVPLVFAGAVNPHEESESPTSVPSRMFLQRNEEKQAERNIRGTVSVMFINSLPNVGVLARKKGYLTPKPPSAADITTPSSSHSLSGVVHVLEIQPLLSLRFSLFLFPFLFRLSSWSSGD